ncbi:MAG TPA: STAS domain-containing protein [Bryobacteraceae bacterium]|nr:STAS domain-containing protein [Bryobacteraceae bacterium]
MPEPGTHRTALDIRCRDEDSGIVVISAAGRLMLGPEGAQLENAIRDGLAKGKRKFILDFTELTHIDSTGIGRCISSLNMTMQAGGKLVIAGATGQVRDGFRVTRLDRVFRFVDDLESARAAVQ